MEGKFGEFGGQYVPETLMNAVQELDKAYNHFKNDPEFIKELDEQIVFAYDVLRITSRYKCHIVVKIRC